MQRYIIESWLIYLSGMVVLGWSLTLVSAYSWIGWASIPLIACCAWHLRNGWKRSAPKDRQALIDDLRFPPVLIFIGLITLAGTLYLTAVLDSLSYRIPRMQIWLQEGGVTFVDNPDGRINFMTPIWEFASTPLYLIGGFRLLWLGSLASWLLLYLMMVTISVRLGAERSTARWLALIPAASVGFVLQAASTMNDVWAAALIGMSLVCILRFEKSLDFRDILGSGLSLALAAGTKPHFAVLALPWLIWAVFSRSRPLLHIQWNWALPVAAIAILCSPFPTFCSNQLHYGSFTGPAGDGGFGFGSPWNNLFLGGIMMIWSIFQLPVNPLAKQVNELTDSFIQNIGSGNLPVRFRLGSSEVPLVDGASIGFVAATVLVFGIVIAIRNRKQIPSWVFWSSIGGVLGMAMALSQVVPSTLGRSFLGFLVLLFPLTVAGLNLYKRKWIIAASLISCLASLAAIVLSPSHPLWPVRQFASSHPGLGEYLEPYIAFQNRTTAGISLVEKIPSSASAVGILANGDQNLIHLWHPDYPKRRVQFLPASVTLDEIAEGDIEYLILAGSGAGSYTHLIAELEADSRFDIAASEFYQTRNDRGKETWLLIHRK